MRSAISAPLIRLVPILALLAGLLTGCSGNDAPWRLRDVSGLMPDLRFDLQSTRDGVASAEDFHGKVVAVYFGYTHCPDVCPMTLGKLREALGRLDADAASVRVLFVTVDPRRDTLPRLEQYLGYFGPEFVGLRGSDSALTELAKRYRVTYEEDPRVPEDGEYTVAHSNGIFIFDRQGRARLLATRSHSIEAIAHDLRLLVERTRS